MADVILGDDATNTANAGKKLRCVGAVHDWAFVIDTDEYQNNPALAINDAASLESLSSLMCARTERMELFSRLMLDSEGFQSLGVGEVMQVLLPMAQECKAIALAYADRTQDLAEQAQA